MDERVLAIMRINVFKRELKQMCKDGLVGQESGAKLMQELCKVKQRLYCVDGDIRSIVGSQRSVPHL